MLELDMLDLARKDVNGMEKSMENKDEGLFGLSGIFQRSYFEMNSMSALGLTYEVDSPIYFTLTYARSTILTRIDEKILLK